MTPEQKIEFCKLLWDEGAELYSDTKYQFRAMPDWWPEEEFRVFIQYKVSQPAGVDADVLKGLAATSKAALCWYAPSYDFSQVPQDVQAFLFDAALQP